MKSTDKETISRTKINMETSHITWRELQRFFASGAAIYVSPDLDLVEVAFQVSEDNKFKVNEWMEAGLVAPVTDAQAQQWYDNDADMWAVVVSPYVLVQPA